MVDAVQEKTAGGVRDLSCVMDTFKPCLECSVTETSMKDNHEQPTSSFQLQEGLRPLMDFLVATMMTRELSSVEKNVLQSTLCWTSMCYAMCDSS